MNIGVFGLGSIGRRHLVNLLELSSELGISEITVFDTDKTRLDDLKYDNIIKIHKIDENISSIDVAFICSPTNTHNNLIHVIYKFCKPHIYLEKPFDAILSGCKEVNDLVLSHDKKIVVGYMLINHPVLQETKSLISKNSDNLGKIINARAEEGFFLPNWHPYEDYRNFYMSKKSGGGGALLDSSHEINYLQWLFGDILNVYGLVDKFSSLEIDSDDLAIGMFKFKSGHTGQVHLDLLQYEETRCLKVVFDKGVIISNLITNEISMFLNSTKSWTHLKLNVLFDEIYHTQLRLFFKKIHGEKVNLIDGHGAIKTMEVIEAIRSSYLNQKSIFLK